MYTKQNQTPQLYEAPLTWVIGSSVEGVLCMSSTGETEEYKIWNETDW